MNCRTNLCFINKGFGDLHCYTCFNARNELVYFCVVVFCLCGGFHGKGYETLGPATFLLGQ